MAKEDTKKRKEKILRDIKRAGSSEYETSWDEGGIILKQKKKVNVGRGRKAKAAGARFELKVRKDLEEKGRVVDKWSNNVDLEYASSASTPTNADAPSEDLKSGRIVPAKRKFNFFSKVMTLGTGFPDFISIQRIRDGTYSVVGVEVKMNGTLSKIEKEKCAFYLKEKTFSEILIARMEKNGRKIVVKYDNFRERYPKFLE